MTWRFQPVYSDSFGERTYSLCEVYFDTDDRLMHWTQENTLTPLGDSSISDLLDDLQEMLSDAALWKPVPYDSLRIGMTFERANHNVHEGV
jgi:hypothetical protein